MSSVRLYTRDEVRRENDGTNKVMMVIHDNVYDVTSYLEQHPGGSDVLLEQGGKDGTVEFDLVGHSLDARELMEQYKVGELIPEDRTGHNEPRWTFMYSLWTYLIPLGIVIIGTMGYKLYKRI